MHIRSTQESIANSEPSVLALIETLAAIAVSAGIAIRFDTVAHVAVRRSVSSNEVARVSWARGPLV